MSRQVPRQAPSSSHPHALHGAGSFDALGGMGIISALLPDPLIPPSDLPAGLEGITTTTTTRPDSSPNSDSPQDPHPPLSTPPDEEAFRLKPWDGPDPYGDTRALASIHQNVIVDSVSREASKPTPKLTTGPTPTKAKPQAKSQTKSQAKPQAKPQAKSQAKPPAKAQAKPSKPPKPAAKSVKSVSKSANRPSGRPTSLAKRVQPEKRKATEEAEGAAAKKVRRREERVAIPSRQAVSLGDLKAAPSNPLLKCKKPLPPGLGPHQPLTICPDRWGNVLMKQTLTEILKSSVPANSCERIFL